MSADFRGRFHGEERDPRRDRARKPHKRRRDYGRTVITDTDRAAFAHVEPPRSRLDEIGSDLPFAGR